MKMSFGFSILDFRFLEVRQSKIANRKSKII